MAPMSDGADPNTGNNPSIKMNSLPSNVEARYIQQLTFWNNTVTSLNALYEKLALSTLDEYDMASGDGKTKGKRKSITAIGDEIEFAMNRVRFYEMKVYGRGLMNLRLRRK